MRFRVNKAALSVSTAVLMVTSMFSMLGTSASAENEIRLSADRKQAAPGDRINVSVDYVPNDTGASGITLNLLYDPDKVAVHIPTAEEADTVYALSGGFSVITNYAYAEGTVRIVGANLMNTNITDDQTLSLASFDVLGLCEGDIDFTVEVETMVSAADGGFVTSKYATVPVTVEGPKPAAVTTVTTPPITTKATTTTEAVTTTKATTTTAAVTTTKATTTTAAVTTTKATTTTAAVTTTKAATTTEAETTTEATTTAAPVTTTAEVTTTTAAPVTTTTAPEALPEETEKPEEPEEGSGDPLFSYHQEGGDFNSESNVSYNIKVSDYVTDYSKHYNIKINVEASANANGGVGMILDGQYQKQNNRLRTGGEETWVLEDIDPSKLGSDLVVALYYLKDNADFSVNSVEFSEVERSFDEDAPDGTGDEAADDNGEEQPAEDGGDDADSEQQEEPAENGDAADSQVTDEDTEGEEAQYEDSNENEDPADESSEIADSADDETDSEEEYNAPEDTGSGEEDTDGGESYDAVSDEIADADTDDTADSSAQAEENEDGTDKKSADADADSDIGEDQSTVISTGTNAGDTSADKTVQPAAKDIEEAVVHASQQADSSSAGKNPATGESHYVRNVLLILSGGYVLWSLLTVLAQHRKAAKEDKE